MPNLKSQSIIFTIAGFAGSLSIASAQDKNQVLYPTKAITIVVPQGAGGTTDLIARVLAQRLSSAFNQPVLVENRPGAGGTIGTEFVTKASPDGYTLLTVPASVTVGPSIYKLAYDPVRDLAPVTLLATLPNILVVHPTLPVKSVRELIALARAKPGQLNYGSSGVGSGPHLAMALLSYMTSISLTHIPYKGGAPAVTALISGEVQLNFATLSTVVPYVQARKLRAIAVTTATRSAVVPNVPTIAESGVPGYQFSTWIGVFAPAKTASPVITRLHGELIKGLNATETRSILGQEGFEPVGNTPSQFASIVQAEAGPWKKVVDAIGIKGD